MRRISRIICLLCLPAALLATGFSAVQAKANVNVNVNINIDFKLSPLFANFPLPVRAEQVDKKRQKHGREWTEYRVGMPAAQCTAFYSRQMPRHGWRCTSRRGNTYHWNRGKRAMVVMIVPVSRTSTLIVVQETGRH